MVESYAAKYESAKGNYAYGCVFGIFWHIAPIFFKGCIPVWSVILDMNIGCVLKGIVIAGVLGVIGFFAAPVLGLNQELLPLESLFATGLFFGYLAGALVTWKSGQSESSCSGERSNENVLYVGNIPFRAREDEVQRLFEAYGEVKSVRLVRGGPNRRPKGYGFVEMASDRDMQAALALNGEEFAGRKLRVNEAKDKK